MYGRDPVMPTDLNIGAPRTEMSKHDYVAELQMRLATIHDILARIHERLRHRMKEYYDRGRVDTELNEGDFVLAYYSPLDSSHITWSWRGPFRIYKKISALKYQLQNPETGEIFADG